MAESSWFASELIAWQRVHGRHGLPWQVTDPYRVWLSEIMLQQTQVATVIGYYARFLQRFPDLQSLANASVDDVLTLWSGLGYYSRARNLHRAAVMVQTRFGGQFPRDPALLTELPGVGRSTAAAIAAFSYGVTAAILDGNVKRVLSRAFAITAPLSAKNDAALWTLAESLLPDSGTNSGVEAYTQGLMDLGATVCTRSRPLCTICPLNARCMARAQGLQASLPTRLKKVGKAGAGVATRRVEHCYMLIAQTPSTILLERRPAVGIWAQLWSFPQFSSLDALQHHAAQLAGSHYDAASLLFLPTTKHSFSHYDLMIEPVQLSLIHSPSSVADPQAARWIAQGALDTLGVPAVVGKLLALCR